MDKALITFLLLIGSMFSQILPPVLQKQPSGGGPGVVAFDAIFPAVGSSNGCVGADPGICANTPAASLTWSHTVASSPIDPSLFVGCVVDTPDSSTLSATFNSVSMTSLGVVHQNNSTAGYTQLFRLAGPATSSHSVVVTMTGGPGAFSCVSVSFTGVNQATPNGTAVTAFGSSTAISSGAVTSATNDIVLDIAGNGAAITSSSQTKLSINSNAGGVNAGCCFASSRAAGAASVTMGYTVTSDFWGIIAVDVKHD